MWMASLHLLPQKKATTELLASSTVIMHIWQALLFTTKEINEYYMGLSNYCVQVQGFGCFTPYQHFKLWVLMRRFERFWLLKDKHSCFSVQYWTCHVKSSIFECIAFDFLGEGNKDLSHWIPWRGVCEVRHALRKLQNPHVPFHHTEEFHTSSTMTGLQ